MNQHEQNRARVPEGWRVRVDHGDGESGSLFTIARGAEERTFYVSNDGATALDVTVDDLGYVVAADGRRIA